MTTRTTRTVQGDAIFRPNDQNRLQDKQSYLTATAAVGKNVVVPAREREEQSLLRFFHRKTNAGTREQDTHFTLALIPFFM